MLRVLDWCANRVVCLLMGHDMIGDRIFDPRAKSVVPGYRCRRCGKTQSMLYRWQETPDREGNDG